MTTTAPTTRRKFVWVPIAEGGCYYLSGGSYDHRSVLPNCNVTLGSRLYKRANVPTTIRLYLHDNQPTIAGKHRFGSLTAKMATETLINYFDLSNERVFYPGTAGYQRRKFDTRPTTISDLRGHEQDFTLEKNGFMVLKADWSEEDVEDTPEHIRDVVFPETIEKVKKA